MNYFEPSTTFKGCKEGYIFTTRNGKTGYYLDKTNNVKNNKAELIRHTQEDWDKHFLEIAKLCSKMSKDPSTKVGAAIKGTDKSVISTGYNGFPPWVDDNKVDLHDRPTKYKYVIHAEENALRFAKSRTDVQIHGLTGCTIYTTLFPCEKCYKLIKDSGIKRIVTQIPSKEHIERWGESWEKVKELSAFDQIEIIFID